MAVFDQAVDRCWRHQTAQPCGTPSHRPASGSNPPVRMCNLRSLSCTIGSGNDAAVQRAHLSHRGSPTGGIKHPNPGQPDTASRITLVRRGAGSICGELRLPFMFWREISGQLALVPWDIVAGTSSAAVSYRATQKAFKRLVSALPQAEWRQKRLPGTAPGRHRSEQDDRRKAECANSMH